MTGRHVRGSTAAWSTPGRHVRGSTAAWSTPGRHVRGSAAAWSTPGRHVRGSTAAWSTPERHVRGSTAAWSTTESAALAGNGVLLVRERAVAAAVQRALERLYQIDRVADVNAFVEPADEGEREALLVREGEDGTVEMALRLPLLGRRELDVAQDADLDPLCQIIEGVSHFVYLADRVDGGREATQLELELQAEVDKYVVLAAAVSTLDERSSARLRARLYEAVSFQHAANTEIGERYRLANELAARFVRSLEQRYLASRRFVELRGELRRFYRMGQEEKLRVGRAA